MIYILNTCRNFNGQYCILTLHMHLFDTVCCICIPLYTTFLMMALKQPKYVGGSSQIKKIIYC